MNFWTKLKKPFKVLAPMAGYTDSAFRLLCRDLGADVVMTELISADAIFYKAKNWYKDEKGVWQSTKEKDETLNLLKFSEGERPLVVQLFGKDPLKFAFAAKWLGENLKPDGIDINMGCPAKKVVKSNHGAALMKDSPLAVEIVKATIKNTTLPVSVKTRLGWESDDEIFDFAKKLKEAGIAALTIHGRTYKDGFKNKARWDNIYQVKELLGDNVLVIGNGDIETHSQIEKKVSDGKIILDGVTIGRQAFKSPWIFSKDSVTKDELKDVILKHGKLLHDLKGERGMIEFRKFLISYTKGLKNSKDLRAKVVTILTINDIKEVVKEL